MPRDGTKNLRPMGERTEEEQKKIAKMGGIASGESRRARKTLREELIALLSIGDYQERITTALVDKAMAGDTRAYEVLRDTIGEKPKDEIVADAKIEVSMSAEIDEYSR